jgi:hypothetical protein
MGIGGWARAKSWGRLTLAQALSSKSSAAAPLALPALAWA